MTHPSANFVELSTDCKVYLRNIGNVEIRDVEAWLQENNWRVEIPPKLVSNGDLAMALRASGTVLWRRESFWDGDGVEVGGKQDQ